MNLSCLPSVSPFPPSLLTIEHDRGEVSPQVGVKRLKGLNPYRSALHEPGRIQVNLQVEHVGERLSGREGGRGGG